MDKYERQYKSFVKRLGFKIYKMYNVPDGVPDFIVVLTLMNLFVEVKGTEKYIDFRKSMCNKDQLKFLAHHNHAVIAFRSPKYMSWKYYAIDEIKGKYVARNISLKYDEK